MPGPGGLINPSAPQQQGEVFSIPYPAAAGTAGPTVNFSNKMAVGQQGVQAVGKRVSGAWLELTNNSDSVLRVQFDTSSLSVPIQPGTWWSGPIPLTSTNLLTTIIQQNAVQFYPLETLFVTFYAPEDLEVGYRPRAGPFFPNLPAAAIGPGTLPAGVLVPFGQVTPGGTPPDTASQYQFVQSFAAGSAIIVVKSPVNDAATHDLIGYHRIQSPGGADIGFRTALDNTNDFQWFDILANQFDMKMGSTGVALTSGGRIKAWSQFAGTGPGTFNHNLGTTPLTVLLTAVNATAQSCAVSAFTATQVTVAIGAAVNWNALALA